MNRRKFLTILAAGAALAATPIKLPWIKESYHYGVDVTFSGDAMVYTLDDFERRILEPAMRRMALDIDRYVLTGALPRMFPTVRRVSRRFWGSAPGSIGG